MRMQPPVICVLFTNGTPWGERGAGVYSGLPESVLVRLLVRNDASSVICTRLLLGCLNGMLASVCRYAVSVGVCGNMISNLKK